MLCGCCCYGDCCCNLQFHLVAPIFVARQLVKHQVGLVWNEVSRRYVDSEPEFYYPEEGWRLKAENKKQGSSNEVWEGEDALNDPSTGYKYICESAKKQYLHWDYDLVTSHGCLRVCSKIQPFIYS